LDEKGAAFNTPVVEPNDGTAAQNTANVKGARQKLVGTSAKYTDAVVGIAAADSADGNAAGGLEHAIERKVHRQ